MPSSDLPCKPARIQGPQCIHALRPKPVVVRLTAEIGGNMDNHIKLQPLGQPCVRAGDIQQKVGILPARIENSGVVGEQFTAGAANHGRAANDQYSFDYCDSASNNSAADNSGYSTPTLHIPSRISAPR